MRVCEKLYQAASCLSRSLMASAKLNGVELQACLTDVLERVVARARPRPKSGKVCWPGLGRLTAAGCRTGPNTMTVR